MPYVLEHYNGEPQVWLRSGACCCHISLQAMAFPMVSSHFGSLNKIIPIDPTTYIFNKFSFDILLYYFTLLLM